MKVTRHTEHEDGVLKEDKIYIDMKPDNIYSRMIFVDIKDVPELIKLIEEKLDQK